jgi:YVTN family beta-propeller protein
MRKRKTIGGVLPACLLLGAIMAPRTAGAGVEIDQFDAAEQSGLIPGGTRLIDPWQPSVGLRGLPCSHVSNGDTTEGDLPRALTYTADGQYLLVANEGTSNVAVLDAATGDVLRTISLSGRPYDVAASSDGMLAVTANIWDDTASIVNYMTGEELAVLAVGEQPLFVITSPDGTYAVVGNMVDQDLSVIDLTTMAVTRTVSGGGYFDIAWSMSMDGAAVRTFTPVILPDNRLVLGDGDSSDVEGYVNFIDLSDGSTETLTVAPVGNFVGASPDGSRVVVVHNPVPDPMTVTVIDADLMQVERVIQPTGSLYRAPVDVIIRPDGSRMSFFAGPTGTMIFDLEDETVPPIMTYQYGYGLSSTPDGSYLFLNRQNCSAILDWETGQPLLFDGAPEFCVPEGTIIDPSDIVAASPVDPVVAMLMTMGSEHVAFFSSDGSDASYLATSATGPGVEGDRCRGLALSADGLVGVSINQYSRNATVYDLATDTAVGWIETDDRPVGVAMTSDGSTALVAHHYGPLLLALDIDSATRTEVPVSGDCGPVTIDSADQYAYFAVIEPGGGKLYRLDMDTLTIAGAGLDTVESGIEEWRYFSFLESTDRGWARPYDLAFRPDGALLAMPGGGPAVSIIDVANWSETARIPLTGGTGTSAARAAFSPDGSALYVVSRDYSSDQSFLHEVIRSGGDWVLDETIAVGKQAVDLELSHDGTRAYIACQDGTRAVIVVDLPTFSVSGQIDAPDIDGSGFNRVMGVEVSADDATVYAMCCDGYLHEIDAATHAITESIDTGGSSGYQFLQHEATRRLYVAAAGFYQDGLVAIDLADSCPEDLDGDGARSLSDLGILLAAFGISDGGDIDGDGDTDLADLGALLAVYDTPCP